MVVQPALKYGKELIRGISNAYRSYTQQYECRILSIEPEIKYEGFGGGPSTGGGSGARAPWDPIKSGPAVRPSVNFCANRFFSQTNGRIATKLAHDGQQVSMHPGCAQGQRSRDTRTFLDSWNELLRH